MKKVLISCMAIVAAVILAVGSPIVSFGQCPCVVVCPAGDGTSAPGPPGGTKTPDLDGNAIVDLVDFAMFAGGYPSPPKPYTFCADYDCNGMIDIVDFAIFAMHYLHAGPFPGYNAPAVDHYKTYETQGPSMMGPVFARDQFGEVPITFLELRKLATPVSKNGEAICDTVAHQTWWEFFYPQPTRMIRAQDQFGEHEWILGEARYLLLPALKNDPTGQPIPQLNHYLCYQAQGPTFGIPVTLVDQFGRSDVIVMEGVYFCNPCEKQSPDGFIYPIIDPMAHLTVYFVDNPMPFTIPVFARDQFMEGELFLFENFYLAVPALKTQVIEPGSSEWNRIKALYDTVKPRGE